MPSSKQPAEVDSEGIQDAVESLTAEVRVLRDVLDDIRTDLQWAIQNDRVIIIPQCVLVAKAAADVPAVDKTAAPPGQLF